MRQNVYFKSGIEMFRYLCAGNDLYSRELELFATLANDYEDSIRVVKVSFAKSKNLKARQKCVGYRWTDFLEGGEEYVGTDVVSNNSISAIEWCEQHYEDGKWEDVSCPYDMYANNNVYPFYYESYEEECCLDDNVENDLDWNYGGFDSIIADNDD